MKLDDKLCPHYLNFDFSENFLNGDEYTVQIEYPYLINKPLKSMKIDLIHKYNEDLAARKQQLTLMRNDFQVVKSTIMNQSFTNSHATVTKGMLNFYKKEIQEGPFSCDYNPYYASGILEWLHLGEGNYLIHPDYKNALRITNLENPWKNKLLINQSFNETITGLSSYRNSDSILLLLKHKKEVNLLKILNLNDVEISHSRRYKTDILDAKINKTKIGVILSNTNAQIYDIETNQQHDLTTYNLSGATRLEFTDENNIMILTQKNLKMLDLRTPHCKLFEPDVNDCNYLCSVKTDESRVYLSTRHHLIMTDTRFLKNTEYCTHLMKSSPCYVDLVDNILCLSGQEVNEKVLFSGRPVSSLPMAIPSISETLDKCRLQKDILLNAEIDERLQKYIGGMKLLSHDNDIFLYSVNSIGDIFKQKICRSSSCDDTHPIEHLYKWINHLPNEPQPLHITHVANLSEARFTLNKSMNQTLLKKFTNKPRKVNYFLNTYRSKYHKNNLGDLASNFLSIWDEDEEEEGEEVNLVPEVAPLDKVSDWIESSYFFD